MEKGREPAVEVEGTGGVLSPASEEDRMPGVQRPHGVPGGSLLTPSSP